MSLLWESVMQPMQTLVKVWVALGAREERGDREWVVEDFDLGFFVALLLYSQHLSKLGGGERVTSSVDDSYTFQGSLTFLLFFSGFRCYTA